MFREFFAPEPTQTTVENAVARRRRRREVENALLSHLMGGFKLTPEAVAALQNYIDGDKSREKAFSLLYKVH